MSTPLSSLYIDLSLDSKWSRLRCQTELSMELHQQTWETNHAQSDHNAINTSSVDIVEYLNFLPTSLYKLKNYNAWNATWVCTTNHSIRAGQWHDILSEVPPNQSLSTSTALPICNLQYSLQWLKFNSNDPLEICRACFPTQILTYLQALLCRGHG